MRRCVSRSCRLLTNVWGSSGTKMTPPVCRPATQIRHHSSNVVSLFPSELLLVGSRSPTPRFVSSSAVGGARLAWILLANVMNRLRCPSFTHTSSRLRTTLPHTMLLSALRPYLGAPLLRSEIQSKDQIKISCHKFH